MVEEVERLAVQRAVDGQYPVVAVAGVVDRQFPRSVVGHRRDPVASAHGLFLRFHVAVNHPFEDLLARDRREFDRVHEDFGQVAVEFRFDLTEFRCAFFRE